MSIEDFFESQFEVPELSDYPDPETRVALRKDVIALTSALAQGNVVGVGQILESYGIEGELSSQFVLIMTQMLNSTFAVIALTKGATADDMRRFLGGAMALDEF